MKCAIPSIRKDLCEKEGELRRGENKYINMSIYAKVFLPIFFPKGNKSRMNQEVSRQGTQMVLDPTLNAFV